ncbi:DUF983 domain-containing protein [Sphingomonas montanisoli]|uniref:DUF983 domain-containing protein n=1 Tax=Sphingomonas montanisoli TaxID=2606412 RepID=A0A5D9CBE2_9SPHN|nr:DUF983 domain-containing protein [Sphingomonas montanisoli]TZG29049.1 DUF983 domain-containing protein [Sphingomonas montanisoli]
MTEAAERPLVPALILGLKGRCPSCGEAPLFGRFLRPLPECPSCGQDWTPQRADDLPAYIVVLTVGHVLAPFICAMNLSYDVSMLVQMILWPGLALVMSLAMIQPVKGAVIALQWARHMHGFGRG